MRYFSSRTVQAQHLGTFTAVILQFDLQIFDFKQQ